MIYECMMQTIEPLEAFLFLFSFILFIYYIIIIFFFKIKHYSRIYSTNITYEY